MTGVQTCPSDLHIPGNGLGLPMVAAILRRLGGSCELSSIQGRGTTVCLSGLWPTACAPWETTTTPSPGVSFGNVAQVLRALGILDHVVDAADPLASDIGRLRAGNFGRKRAR